MEWGLSFPGSLRKEPDVVGFLSRRAPTNPFNAYHREKFHASRR